MSCLRQRRAPPPRPTQAKNCQGRTQAKLAKKARVQRTREAVGVGSPPAATQKLLLVVVNNNENKIKYPLCVRQHIWRFMCIIIRTI